MRTSDLLLKSSFTRTGESQEFPRSKHQPGTVIILRLREGSQSLKASPQAAAHFASGDWDTGHPKGHGGTQSSPAETMEIVTIEIGSLLHLSFLFLTPDRHKPSRTRTVGQREVGRFGCLAFAWVVGPTFWKAASPEVAATVVSAGLALPGDSTALSGDKIRLECRLCYKVLNVNAPRG